ncbi:MAG: hypothetical protein GX561_07815 [Lentisphaerae bacterium]|nr:hypothetical protein [Lentisphaerota bacterium]
MKETVDDKINAKPERKIVDFVLRWDVTCPFLRGCWDWDTRLGRVGQGRTGSDRVGQIFAVEE